jgi:hypothetical protein
MNIRLVVVVNRFGLADNVKSFLRLTGPIPFKL